MANHKSSQKDILTSRKAALRNRSYKSQVRTAIKRVYRDVEKKDLAKAEIDLRLACSIIDRTRSKHIQALNTTNRQKKRVYDMVNKLAAELKSAGTTAAPAVETKLAVEEKTPKKAPIKKTATSKEEHVAAAPVETPVEKTPKKVTRTAKTATAQEETPVAETPKKTTAVKKAAASKETTTKSAVEKEPAKKTTTARKTTKKAEDTKAE